MIAGIPWHPFGTFEVCKILHILVALKPRIFIDSSVDLHNEHGTKPLNMLLLHL